MNIAKHTLRESTIRDEINFITDRLDGRRTDWYGPNGRKIAQADYVTLRDMANRTGDGRLVSLLAHMPEFSRSTCELHS